MGCGVGIPVCAAGACSAGVHTLMQIIVPMGGAGLGLLVGLMGFNIKKTK